jgi:CheY-like chemotaxis protein
MGTLSGHRILVLDDEPLAALMMERMLKELGCSVPGRTGKAADAMAIIETDRPGLDAHGKSGNRGQCRSCGSA